MIDQNQSSKPVIRIYPDPEAVAAAAVELFVNSAGQAIQERDTFSVLLSGGATPRMVYPKLAPPGQQLEWKKMRLFWGDERCVPPEHVDSNYRMVQENLLAHLGEPPEIFRMQGELDPNEAAGVYEADLRTAFGIPFMAEDVFPRFDLVLLGMGEDGHIASLFPGSPALNEKKRWVTWVEHHQPPPPMVERLTVTLPLINSAGKVVFLVTGENKSQRVAQVFGPKFDESLPAAWVRPGRGELIWLLDEAAAKDLDPSLRPNKESP